ncbi:hypothetical protein [Acetivibrio cellulolyticus]|uniref:hypothetical protein n=1 Tax=Acetivibrio cellulolyticus TaxID=35830 RepID=UPI0001E2F673|nr:hypothetical protein [Acetivibrio cellulolyticus]
MKRKPGIFLFAAVFIVLSANYLLAKNPIGNMVNLKNLWFGVGLLAVSALMGFANIFAKKTFFKSYIYYKPREVWVIAFLVFLEGLIVIAYYLIDVYFTNNIIINELYINIIIQLLVSVGLIAVLHEVYSYMYEYPVRRVLKVMDKAGQLIDNMRFNEALTEFDKVQRKLDCCERPHIYGWVKQAKGVCYIELSKHEDKKQNLLMAAKEFEEILKLKELQGQHGHVKVDIGNIFYDIAEMDNDIYYYESALGMFSDAIKHYKSDRDFDGYMNALSNAEKTKTVLILEKTS